VRFLALSLHRQRFRRMAMHAGCGVGSSAKSRSRRNPHPVLAPAAGARSGRRPSRVRIGPLRGDNAPPQPRGLFAHPIESRVLKRNSWTQRAQR
jgi:hypothetical protein